MFRKHTNILDLKRVSSFSDARKIEASKRHYGEVGDIKEDTSFVNDITTNESIKQLNLM